MSAKKNMTDYGRIETEWTRMAAWLTAKDAGEKRMGEWLEAQGWLPKMPKGQRRGQDYIRYIQMNSKVADALTTGEEWKGFVGRMVAEAGLKKRTQQATGAGKVLLSRTKPGTAGEARAPREVREPSPAGGGGSGTRRERLQPTAEEIRALLAFVDAAEAAAEAAGHTESLQALASEPIIRCRRLLEGMAERKAAWATKRGGSDNGEEEPVFEDVELPEEPAPKPFVIKKTGWLGRELPEEPAPKPFVIKKQEPCGGGDGSCGESGNMAVPGRENKDGEMFCAECWNDLDAEEAEEASEASEEEE